MMKKINFGKFLKIFVILLVIVPSIFLFSACSFSPFSGESAYEIAVRNGFQGTEQEWLESLQGKDGVNGENGKDAESIDTYQIYEKAVETGEYSGSYLDFIKEYFSTSGDETSIVTAEAVRSVVKVYAYNSLLSSSYSRLGSGVIASFDSEGNAYVITNYHVTASGTSSNYKYYKCVLYGETTYYSAVFVGGTRTYDISVLKIEKGQGFEKTNAKPAKFSLSGTLVGQECISVGNNEGMGITASKGIVSVDSEEVTMDIAGVAGSYRVLRHDTFIGHGNSGGGLFNLNGELIGITNGGKEGTLFNYALPSALVYKVYRNIMENCLNTENQKPFTFVLGIYGTTISSNLGLDKNGNIQMIDKVKISGISSESETEKEGTLMVNDILKSVTIDGTEYEITRYYHLKEYLLNVRAGSTVTVKVSRTLPTGVEQEVSATFVINASNLSEVA